MSETRSSPQTARKADPREVLDGVKRVKILALLAMGCSRRMAARQVGCSPSTITRTADREAEFHAQLADAEAQADVRALRLITHAAQQERYWRVAAWLLERRNPEEYGRRAPFTFTGQQVIDLLVRGLKEAVPAVAGEKLPLVMMSYHELLLDVAEAANLRPMEPEELIAEALPLPAVEEPPEPAVPPEPAISTARNVRVAASSGDNGNSPVLASPGSTNGHPGAPAKSRTVTAPPTNGHAAPAAENPIVPPHRTSCLEQFVQRSPRPELQTAGT